MKYVSLANIYSLTDQTMRALAGYTSELTALDITGCWRITDQGMNLVTEYCPKLQVLNVTDCRYDIFSQMKGPNAMVYFIKKEALFQGISKLHVPLS